MSKEIIEGNKTKNIQLAISKMLVENGSEAVCENFGHTIGEMDVAAISKLGMLHEYEVKISRSDFLADKKKHKRTGILKFDRYANPEGLERSCPNYFYYVCPDDLIKPSEIPFFAGLIYYYDNGFVGVIKSPKRIHKIPSDREKVISKMLRITIQRKYLGCAMLTFKNNKIKAKYNTHNQQQVK